MRASAPRHPAALALTAAAVSLAWGTLAPVAAHAQIASQASNQALRSYSIPAAPVEAVLNQLAREAQVKVSVTGDPVCVARTGIGEVGKAQRSRGGRGGIGGAGSVDGARLAPQQKQGSDSA
jgi:hypothetical protein